MLLTEMKIGKPIELLINRDGYRYRLISKIEEVGENCIYISLIATRTKIFKFESTDQVEIIYRLDDRLWKFRKIKGKVDLLDGEKVHCLSGSLQGESYNRRNAYRVFIGEEVPVFQYTLRKDISAQEILKLKSEKEEWKEEDLYEIKKSTGMLKDLSENGIGIFSNEIFEQKTELSIQVPSKYGMLKIKAVVVRTSDEKSDLYKHFYGCNITESEKYLTKYLFELQREYLQKTRN